MTSVPSAWRSADTNFTPVKRRVLKNCMDCGDGIPNRGRKKYCYSCSSLQYKKAQNQK